MRMNDGILDFYDSNIRTLAEIVCDYELKDKFVSYLVNDSAQKNGNRNVNSNEIFKRSYLRGENGKIDHTKLFTSTASTMNLGEQMNADHDLDFSHVSEMSQMISSLIQGGKHTSLVNSIYREIGKVAAQALRNIEIAISNNNSDKIYQILGESLMRSFDTGNKNTTGLAQSFLMKAKIALANENVDFKIPFSAPTINSAFISDVISSINKKGIRRKYAGIASVLTPSYDMIQYYRYGGQSLMFTEFAKKVLEEHPRQISSNETPEEAYRKDSEHVDKLMNDIDYAITNNVAIEYQKGKRPAINDTIIIEDIDELGNIYKKSETLDTYDKFDYYRNLHPTAKFYN